MLHDQRPEISRSGKSAAQDPHRDARRHDLVLYCESKDSFVSARVATALRNKGVRQIRVLVGERIAEMKRLGIELIPSPWSPPPAEAPPASD